MSTSDALHLLVGGQRSGKSRHAERMGQAWLAGGCGRRVAVLATATAQDDEMAQRIARHRLDRPAGFDTVEEPIRLGMALRDVAAADTLVVIDCLTLWLTNVLMPMPWMAQRQAEWPALRDDLLTALQDCRDLGGKVVVISNEVGWGVVPLGREVRHFVDELGRLNQAVADGCDQVSLVVAGRLWTQAGGQEGRSACQLGR